jgi:hypothetical protein
VEDAYIAAQKIPNARLHIFDCCGHWTSIENAQEFNNIVLEFLAELDDFAPTKSKIYSEVILQKGE